MWAIDRGYIIVSIFMQRLYFLICKDCCDFKSEISQILPENLPSESVFSWLEYDETNQPPLTGRIQQLLVGFRFDKSKKQLQAHKWQKEITLDPTVAEVDISSLKEEQ